MTQASFIALDSVAHQNVRIAEDTRFSHSKDFNAVLLGFNEIASISGCMPMLVTQDSLGSPDKLIAVVGWPETGNVFCGARHWKAHAVPLSIQCAPFDYGIDGERLTVLIDEHSPRMANANTDNAAPLFSGDGAPSTYLKQVQSQLSALASGQQQANMMVKALTDLDLLTPLSVTRVFTSGEQEHTNDLLTINEEKFAQLDAATIHQLHTSGLLMAINAMILSLRQFNRLVQLTQGLANPVTKITLKTKSA